MKPLITLAAGLAGLAGALTSPTARAQAPAWQMALALASSANNTSSVDAAAAGMGGDVYVAGHFSGQLQVGAATLSSAGGADIFVARWSAATQAFAWGQRAGGTGNDKPLALTVRNGSLYVGGYFDSPVAAFGGTSLPNATTAGGQNDAFIAKLTDNGPTAAFGWAVRLGGAGDDQVTSLATAGPALYVAGSFASPTLALGASTLTNAGPGGSDAFVAQVRDLGTGIVFPWALAAGGPDDDAAYAVAATGTDVYLGGSFASTARFGSSTRSTTAGGGDDAFVAKVSDNGSGGTFGWVQQAGGYGYEAVRALAVQGSSVYATGETAGPTATYGTITLTNPDPSGTNSDVFVAKLTDAGASSSFAWVQPISGRSTEVATALAVQGNAVYVAGQFYGLGTTFGPFTLDTAGNLDGFLAKLTDAGASSSFAWAKQAGGTALDMGNALAVSGNQVYLAGAFASPSIAFDTHPVASPSGTAIGFLASLTDPLLTATAPATDFAVSSWPNPAHDVAVVQLPAGATALSLFDGLGQRVRTATLAPSARRFELPVRGLPTGLYIVQVQAGLATATQRLVVE